MSTGTWTKKACETGSHTVVPATVVLWRSRSHSDIDKLGSCCKRQCWLSVDVRMFGFEEDVGKNLSPTAPRLDGPEGSLLGLLMVG
jgi:hypothetical protein